MTTLALPDLTAYTPLLESALAYADGTHTVDDVRAMIAAGAAQPWFGPRSIVVTECVEFPRMRALHFWLAAGDRRELAAMAPEILAWGKAQGCTRATLTGRKGWTRTFLRDTGWQVLDRVIMERAL